MDSAAERLWQQQQMQIAVAAARIRELEASLQVKLHAAHASKFQNFKSVSSDSTPYLRRRQQTTTGG
jgi:hypothetical protein